MTNFCPKQINSVKDLLAVIEKYPPYYKKDYSPERGEICYYIIWPCKEHLAHVVAYADSIVPDKVKKLVKENLKSGDNEIPDDILVHLACTRTTVLRQK